MQAANDTSRPAHAMNTNEGSRDVASPSGDRPHRAPRCLAFYLPQYHPIPENDANWGKDFTEWTNVDRSKPVFPGHYQPHVPADLGHYDLREPQARAAQAALASEFGIDGLVYYHYWFNGHQVLDRPFNEVLASGEPSMPFCLAWANENWTRRWDGGSEELILGQTYSLDDDLEHIRALRTALMDERYIRRDDKPVLLIYRANLLPDVRATTEVWRKEVESWGLKGLYLLRIESFPDENGDPTALGFDGAVEFQPRWWVRVKDPPLLWLVRALRQLSGRRGPFRHRLVSYSSLVDSEMRRGDPGYVRWPGVTPGYDNSPRRQRNAFVYVGSTAARYGEWLRDALRRAVRMGNRAGGNGETFVFVNAWNEWGEGNHLEPDQKHGRSFLESHRREVALFRDSSAGA